MSARHWIMIAGIVFVAGAAQAQVAYHEVSSGLSTLRWDGGRSMLRFGDLNADGQLDLVTVGDHGSPRVNTQMHGVTVWFGDGNNHWSVSQFGEFGYGGITLGDVNNDGLLDVGYGVHHNWNNGDLGDQLLEVALGDGTGTFWTAWDDNLARDGQTWGMFGTEFLDLNSDGWLDVASVGFGATDGLHAYLNNHDGTWTHTFGFLGGNTTMDIGSGDFNNDGATDLIVAHVAGTVWINTGNGTLVQGDTNLPGGGGFGRRSPSAGDVDGDGRDDLAIVTNAGGVAVYRSMADGTWTNISGSLPVGGTIEASLLVDMDADGFLDLVTFGNRTGQVWLGDGGTDWALASTFHTPGAGNYAALAVGDVDHNGRPDIAVVDEEGNWPNFRNQLHLFTETSIASEPSIRITKPSANHILRAGSVVFIDWSATVPAGNGSTVSVDFSRNGPTGPWNTIAVDAPNNGRYQITLNTVAPSLNAYIRTTLSTGDTTAESTVGPYTIFGSACEADFNADGTVNTLDVLAYLNAWSASDSSADFNGDGTVNTLDMLAFLNAWTTGCL